MSPVAHKKDATGYMMHNGYVSLLFLPSLPAWLLVGGMFWYLMALYYFGVESSRTATSLYFGGLALWLSSVLLPRVRTYKFVWVDALFFLFVAVLIGRGVSAWLTEHEVYSYFKYFPFLVVLPYLAGRLFELRDIQSFLDVVIGASIVAFPVVAIELKAAPANIDRPLLFGYSHGALLAGMTFALGAIAIAGKFLRRGTGGGSVLQDSFWLSLLGIFSYMLVVISARGFLAAMLLAMFLLLLVCGSCGWGRKVLVAVAVMIPLLLALQLNPQRAGFVAYGVQGLSVATVNAVSTAEGRSLSDSENEGGNRCAELFGDATHRGNSFAARAQLWMDSFSILKSDPIMGVGPGRFGSYSCAPYPHSTVLHAMSELGLLGGISLLMLMGGVAASLLKRLFSSVYEAGDASCWSLFGIFLLICLSDQVYGNYFQAGMFFLVCGMAVSLSMGSSRAGLI